MLEVVRRNLLVVESNGAPRSGKGTITNALTQAFPDAEQDETGADYRAVTYGLYEDGHIEEDMDVDVLQAVISELDKDEIADYAAQRHEIQAESSEDPLYVDRINNTVASVGELQIVRAAVKTGFARRVKKHVDNPNTNFLFVDGRNLAPVIQAVEGAELFMRFFVDCQPHVAALREAARNSKDLSDPENDEWLRQARKNIKQRKLQDEIRELDAVKPDEDAIRYWHNDDVMGETVEYIARTRGISIGIATEMINTRFRADGRHGAGAKAIAESRQVYFDTSEINLPSMINLARRMVDEALAQKSGFHKPLSDSLIR